MSTKQKSQAEIEIEALADVFNIATTGFDEFYKAASEKKSGYSSTSASSGDFSTSASSGHSSKSASSGDFSKSASSGYSSTSASSGGSSKSASSGGSSKSASSGNFSTSASSGDFSTSASSGDFSTSASSGHSSKSASSGNFSKSECAGEHSACASVGYRAAVKGDLGNLLMASEYVQANDKLVPVGGKADLVDGKILKPGCWYIVENGKWVEVDFTDKVFSYVLSNKKGIKKVKTENGKILFVVHDENGNSAHGETIAEAREDLIYKVVAKFDGALPKKATGKEWIGIYRAVTGACSAGVRGFVESNKIDVEKSFTAKEIAKLVQGQFGAEQFAKKLQEAA